jgi:O-acetyl-ADP-ribose deacetylase (regulator of RNase III)
MPATAVLGDIVQRQDDAIVNSANASLWAGGGVCGAIHAAAGPELEAACRAIGPIGVGEAVVTRGFNLSARHVIHAVGPRWLGGGRGEPERLEQCYASIFECVAACGARSVAIPSISAGVHRYPPDMAAEVAVRMAIARDHPGLTITFVCFDEALLQLYRNQLEALFGLVRHVGDGAARDQPSADRV